MLFVTACRLVQTGGTRLFGLSARLVPIHLHPIYIPRAHSFPTKGFCGASGEATARGVNLQTWQLPVDKKRQHATQAPSKMDKNLKHIVSTTYTSAASSRMPICAKTTLHRHDPAPVYHNQLTNLSFSIRQHNYCAQKNSSQRGSLYLDKTAMQLIYPQLGAHQAAFIQKIGTYGRRIGTYGKTIGTYGQTIGTYPQTIGTCSETIGTYGKTIGTYGQTIGTYG